MGVRKELEKLQAMRAELEAEALLLKEEQENLENNVLALEEKVVIEEMKKERAVIEELKTRNEITKDAIASLEAKKEMLVTMLEQTLRAPEAPSPEMEKAKDVTVQPEETEATALLGDAVPEEVEESGVTVTAIDSEALFEDQEVLSNDSSRKEKKKRRFF